MLIPIKREKTMKEMQNEFSMFFPFLKLELLKPVHTSKNETENTLQRSEKKLKGDFVIYGEETVAELQKLFKESLGLRMKLSRKNNHKWVRIQSADPLSLKEHNELARNEAYEEETRFEDFMETEF